MLAGGAAALSGAFVAARWFNVWAESGDGRLTAPEAHRAAQGGEVLLIDIRRPDEWQLTGVPQGSVPIDMRSPDFAGRLQALVGGDPARPVALICARGVRSRYLAGQLREAGFTAVLDVPEGMMGSGAGPGWLRRGLPVSKDY